MLIGFSAGIISGLYLASKNKGVNQLINNIPNPGKDQNKNHSQPSIQVFNDQVEKTAEKPPKNIKDVPEISTKQYLIYAGKFRDIVAYKLGLNLKKQHFSAFLVKSKSGTKLYVGSYSDIKIAKKDLNKIKKISSEYFGNAVIKVHLSDKTDNSS
jgi:hypothetical protein